MKPNVLWIFTDQHRGQAMSCAGDPNIETPNLDRLGAEGVRFTNAYSNSPICTPARACVYTGQYITSHGCVANHHPLLPDAAPQMAQVMGSAGYTTAHFGKWHLAGGAAGQHYVAPYFRPGWDEWIGWECMHSQSCGGTYHNTGYSKGNGNNIRRHVIDKFQPDWLTDRTIEFLNRQAGTRPWFHVVSIETPHGPCDAPANVSERHYEPFKERKIEARPNVTDDISEYQFARGYYSHIADIDDNVGRILRTLEETAQLENTIVFYFSDHGELMRSHGRSAKMRPEEESSNVPFLVRLPACLDSRRMASGEKDDAAGSGVQSPGEGHHNGRPPVTDGHVSNAFISLVDLMPTTLRLCGIDIPTGCGGEDLSGLVRGETGEGADHVYMQFEGAFYGQTDPTTFWRSIRRGKWKYTENLDSGPYQLFNLADDPYEMNNLVGEEEYAEDRAELRSAMVAKASEVGDDFFDRELPRRMVIDAPHR